MHRARWVLLKDVGLLSDVLTLFLRALFALQRRRARRQGLRGGQVGAVSFIQFFGSALQVTLHFHSLVPDGVFVPREGDVRFEALPPPTQGGNCCAGRRWTSGPLPESSPGAPCWKASPCMPIRTSMPTTGRGWSEVRGPPALADADTAELEEDL